MIHVLLQIVFEAIRGNGDKGDIAIDDVAYSNGACSNPGTAKKKPVLRAGLTLAQNLAKWKKLEPNDIDFSQGFSKKVESRSFSVFNSAR